MKVCYFIQTHKNPEQIYRLVRTIKTSSPDSLVLISHDFSGCKLELKALENLQGVEVLDGIGGRGDFSILQGYMDAVNWLFTHNLNFDWLINLSGQDYPTKPLSKIEEFLSHTQYDGFLEYFEVFSPESHWSIQEGSARYMYRYQKHKIIENLPEWFKEIITPIKIINYIQPFFRINIAYGMLGTKTSTPFNEKFRCYGGSYFCTLSKKCIKYLHEFYNSNPQIIEYYRQVCVSDESFIQTILINSHLFQLFNGNKIYFDFSESRNGRPCILTTKDYDSLLNSDAHFARKFDLNVDGKILDLLDRIILDTAQESTQDLRNEDLSLRPKRSVGKQSQDFCDYVAVARNDAVTLLLRKS